MRARAQGTVVVDVCAIGVPWSRTDRYLETFAQLGLRFVRSDSTLANPGGHTVVVVATTGSDDAIRTLKDRRPTVVVVALVPRASWSVVGHALRAGADAVIDLDMPPMQAARIVRAAIDGMTVLPTAVVMEHFRDGDVVSPLTSVQEYWLGVLADGATVSQLARREHQSVRTMKRNLHQIYLALDLNGLREALAWLRDREHRSDT